MYLRDYFGHDDEIPGGFQDADIEMSELQEAAKYCGECDARLAKGGNCPDCDATGAK